MRACWVALVLLFAAGPAVSQEAVPVYRIKYLASDVAYVDAGSAAGLAEGMRLIVKRPVDGQSVTMAPVLAELKVISVASTSAACEIVSGDRRLQAGDAVVLHPDDVRPANGEEIPSEEPAFAQVLEFKESDPFEEELRSAIARPPLREINQLTGRIGFEQDFIVDRSPNGGGRSRQNGVSLRFDFTRIGGTYWSLGGYWRARLNSRRQPGSPETLQDVMQRVYQFGLRHDGPQSRWVVGIGRLMVPWAGSLNLLDGGYLGRRLGRSATVAFFTGTTPDPTSWNYEPDRQIAGALAAFEAGTFETARYTSSTGVAVSRLSWRPERQFLFAENNLLVKQYLHIQHNLEVDYRSGGRFESDRKISLTRSFLTARAQPVSRLSLDVTHNYFRVAPTFDPRLVSSGLVDNSLFQGLSGGVRLELPFQIVPYATIGTSSRSEDGRSSRSRMYGVTAGRSSGKSIRVDLRYSTFQGTVGEGEYRALSVQKEIKDIIRLEVMGGDQLFASSLVTATRSRFLSTNMDWFAGRHIVVSFAGSRYRGGLQNYDQGLIQLGYRF